jgi:hypothetical protein
MLLTPRASTTIFLHEAPHLPVWWEIKNFIVCVFLCGSACPVECEAYSTGVANISNIQQKRSSADPEKLKAQNDSDSGYRSVGGINRS